MPWRRSSRSLPRLLFVGVERLTMPQAVIEWFAELLEREACALEHALESQIKPKFDVQKRIQALRSVVRAINRLLST